MINSVTFRVVARKHSARGVLHINAQCFVNKQRVVIPLSIEVGEQYWSPTKELVKSTHPDALQHNSKIATARSHAATIAAMADGAGVRLTRDYFRKQMVQSASDGDFISFWTAEIEERATATKSKLAQINEETKRQHKAAVKKFSSFRQRLSFQDYSGSVVKEYRDWLQAKGNQQSTISTALKNLQTYTNIALERGLLLHDPFKGIRIARIKSRIEYLTPVELKRALEMYDSQSLPTHLQQSLLLFLIACFLSFRIGDIRRLHPSWVIRERTLRFMPRKTRRYEKWVEFTYGENAHRLLSDYFRLKGHTKIKSDQKTNTDLKIIAAHLGLRTRVSMHVGRHTFGTMYMYLGGDLHTLMNIMGHTNINTTLGYAHASEEIKATHMKKFDLFFNADKPQQPEPGHRGH